LTAWWAYSNQKNRLSTILTIAVLPYLRHNILMTTTMEIETKERVCPNCNGHGTPYVDVQRYGTMIQYSSAYPRDPLRCELCRGLGRIKEAIYKPVMPSFEKKVASAKYSAEGLSLRKLTIYSALALLAKVVNDRAGEKENGIRKIGSEVG